MGIIKVIISLSLLILSLFAPIYNYNLMKKEQKTFDELRSRLERQLDPSRSIGIISRPPLKYTDYPDGKRRIYEDLGGRTHAPMSSKLIDPSTGKVFRESFYKVDFKNGKLTSWVDKVIDYSFVGRYKWFISIFGVVLFVFTFLVFYLGLFRKKKKSL